MCCGAAPGVPGRTRPPLHLGIRATIRVVEGLDPTERSGAEHAADGVGAPDSFSSVADGATGPGVDEPPEAWPTGRLLSAAARRVERAWNEYLAQWSLSHASLPVLALLAGGALSQRQIAERLGVTEQTTSRMVAGLERSGYIVRAPHAHDRRRRTVQLTPRGRRCLSELNDAAVISGLVQHDLSNAETAELRRLLIRFLG